MIGALAARLVIGAHHPAHLADGEWRPSFDGHGRADALEVRKQASRPAEVMAIFLLKEERVGMPRQHGAQVLGRRVHRGPGLQPEFLVSDAPFVETAPRHRGKHQAASRTKQAIQPVERTRKVRKPLECQARCDQVEPGLIEIGGLPIHREESGANIAPLLGDLYHFGGDVGGDNLGRREEAAQMPREEPGAAADLQYGEPAVQSLGQRLMPQQVRQRCRDHALHTGVLLIMGRCCAECPADPLRAGSVHDKAPILNHPAGEAPIMPEIDPVHSASGGRNRLMDMTRGFALMGIVLMNIIAFSMPQAAYLNPDAWGGGTVADRMAWALSFILIDGKMRGLFALLFGGSMLLLMDRTEMSGGNGRRRHVIRCLWLLPIGVVHYLLLWWGDILALYAVAGLVAVLFTGRQPLQLVVLAFLAFAIHFLIVTGLMMSIYQIQGVGTGAGATLAESARWRATLEAIGDPAAPSIAREVMLYRGDWAATVVHKARDYAGWALSGIGYMGFETLGFMLLGMAMLKGGFLTGAWRPEQYLGTARHCFLIGLPPMVALALWVMLSGYGTVTTFGVVFAWSFPFRIPLTVGFAALIMALLVQRAPGPLLMRVEAAGRMALSNYLGTSLVLAALFYGWGLGLFATLSRAQVYLLVLPIWGLMLLWSRPWLARFRYGPLEWLWRSLTMGRPQAMRPLTSPEA